MKNNQKIILILTILLILPSIYALTITNTTFHSSISNYTIHIDSITLDNVTVTNSTIEFYNLTSVGSNFTNINDTYDARADFYGLDVGLTIRNINTSTDLFTSSAGNQDYNATFIIGHLLRIMSGVTESSTSSCSFVVITIINLIVLFFTLAIIMIPLSLFLFKGELLEDIDIKLLITIFIGIIMGVIFLRIIANSVASAC